MKGSHALFPLLYLALFLSIGVLSSSSSSSSSSSHHYYCDQADSLLLLQFIKQFEGHKKLGWNESSSDCCKWEGVTCDTSTGHVIGLDLNSWGLHGPIHPNSTIFHLHHLQNLNLAFNDFYLSPLPNEIGSLTSLTHLNISTSSLYGIIPFEISYLSKLISLDLSFNYNLQANDSSILFLHNLTQLELLSLSGNGLYCSIPRNISTSLKYLDLSLNDISGSIPDTIFQLSELQSLILHENTHLFGSLPKFSWSCNHTLQCLDLSDTSMTGELPNAIGNLRYLNYFSLSRDTCIYSGVEPLGSFFGSIPESIGNLTHLKVLDLGCNDFNGSVPFTISKLNQLTTLDLSSNYFEGGIPDVFSSLQEITTLDLERNTFTGLFPISVLNLTRLEGLVLEDYSLIGSLPSVGTGLQNLPFLSLSGNALFGTIPPWILSIPSLIMLDLSQNQFTGQLPQILSASRLHNLQILSLSGNALFGTIPPWIFSIPSLDDLDLSQNQFTGQLLGILSESLNATRLKNLRTLSLSGNALNGTIPSWIFSIPSLRKLDLSQNQFIGQHPGILTESLNASRLKNLETLSLYGNALNGTIPSWIFSIPSLAYLDLSQNQFTGQLPGISSESLISVVLSDNQLYGQIPPSFLRIYKLDLSFNPFSWNNDWKIIANLSDFQIQELWLSSCEIRVFPTFIRNLTASLTLIDLSNNQLEGQIPNWFTSMDWSLIQYLDFSQNRLIGGINQLFIPNILYLDLHSNQLQGPLTITICNLSSLQLLNLKYNKFNGLIPQCLGEFDQLSVLDLGMNNFNGIVPTSFPKGCSFTTIALNGNQLEGPIPRSLVSCTKLEVLDLANNKLIDTFPNWLGYLQELEVLILSSNKLYGPITSLDSEIRFSNVRIFDLSCNSFSGVLPKKLFNDFKAMVNVNQSKKEASYMDQDFGEGKLYNISINLVVKGNEVQLEKVLTILTTIDLSSNQIEGQIPMSIGNLNSLRLLNISHNCFNGSIPHQLGDIKLLESLDISWNQLIGRIPEQITSLTFLEVLNLSQNHLVGPIPTGKQFNTFGNDSYGGNLNLCGFPLSRGCNDNSRPHETHQHVEQEEKSYFLSGFTWRVVVIGFGCGMVFGILIENIMSRIGKPEWFVNFYGGNRHRKVSRPKRNGRRH
ncbi:PREDICTED: receptor-like protein 12 [Ipomoea nil]|uniref:receptor-like protein 12 n=1 Tax=Ipomoea nil TaxID=35883 RepID=UPI0009012287|nr:PREDICTED: receptor-like protein 12 [Ipomoea nil]